MDDKSNFQCPNCEKNYDNLTSLAKHCSRTHKQSIEALYLKLNNLSVVPTCKCGCGGKVLFVSAYKGYREYIRGHISRITNNWGNNPKAQKNSLKTRREMLKDGTWKLFALKETGEAWNLPILKLRALLSRN